MAVTQQFSVAPVQGKESALVYPVGIGQGVFLFDFDQGKFWLKQNTTGYNPTLREFTFNEIEVPEIQNGSVSRSEFDTLSQNVSELSNNVAKLIAELGGATNE